MNEEAKEAIDSVRTRNRIRSIDEELCNKSSKPQSRRTPKP